MMYKLRGMGPGSCGILCPQPFNSVTRFSFYVKESTRRTLNIVKSQNDDKGNDWDAAWSKFKEQVNDTVDTPAGSRRSPPKRSVKSQFLSPSESKLRQQERFLLDIWTTEEFYKIGAAGALVLLFFFVIYVGPPPSDSRCTLPWC